MLVKIINWEKDDKIEKTLDKIYLSHESVCDLTSEEIFEHCQHFFEEGFNVRVNRAGENVVLAIDTRGFGKRVQKKMPKSGGPKKGYTRGSTQNEHKEGEVYSVEDVLSHVKERGFKHRKRKVAFNGDDMNVSSLRLNTFKEHGCVCVNCGAEGTMFLKDRQCADVSWHFNLYGKDNNGDLVLFTKDHIVPKSKGGKDNIENMQTMCIECNNHKGNAVS
jgi:hypothetical protein